MSLPGAAPSKEASIGKALIALGAVALFIKLGGFALFKWALSLLWPLVLIGIGISMYGKSNGDDSEPD